MDEGRRAVSEQDMAASIPQEFIDAAGDAIFEWVRRWHSEQEDPYRATCCEDGTVLVERDTGTGTESVRLRFGVVAVPVPEEENKPTGLVLTRPWKNVPPGWFVNTPDGAWFEVTATKREGLNQLVTLRARDGRTGTFPRSPEGEVKVRRGTVGEDINAAMDRLAAALGTVEILEG